MEAGNSADASSTAARQRVAELTAALHRLAQPTERERLRAAMNVAAKIESGSRRNGADSGAEAVLELLQ